MQDLSPKFQDLNPRVFFLPIILLIFTLIFSSHIYADYPAPKYYSANPYGNPNPGYKYYSSPGPAWEEGRVAFDYTIQSGVCGEYFEPAFIDYIYPATSSVANVQLTACNGVDPCHRIAGCFAGTPTAAYIFYKCPEDPYYIRGIPHTCKTTPTDPKLGGDCPSVGNPIKIGTGSKWLVEVDFSSNKEINFNRYYRSISPPFYST